MPLKNDTDKSDIIIVGSGNAALCAGIAASSNGATVLMIDSADEEMAGGNSKYTAGAMRFVYNNNEDLTPLLKDPEEPRLPNTDFGSYTAEKFEADLLGFNDGRPLSAEQRVLIDSSYETMLWLSEQGVKFNPIYERQSFEKDGKHIFWGGLTLATDGEGVGLVEAELDVFLKLGGQIKYNTKATKIIVENESVSGIICETESGDEITLKAKCVILGCGGFESNPELRKKYIGPNWEVAKVRGTPHNMGAGIQMAIEHGAVEHGFFGGCHATPMDLHMKDYGNLGIPHLERKNYRKICYFLGVMLNANGERFVDEGKDFRNYTYAQFGGAVLEQPNHFAWQIFDSKTDHLLYGEYTFHDAHFVEADTIETLVEKLEGIADKKKAIETLATYNAAVDETVLFEPTIKDGKGTVGLNLPKSNWAQVLDTPPYKAYPVTGGITFTYGGLKVDAHGAVLKEDDQTITGLFACGELVGGVFFNGYPGGSGLTSGAVFGRRAGEGAAQFVKSTL
ncbi:MAG: FAD-dependent tricarballylate dehydrogenase TcuA [Rhizobiales bacterium]|nr:FAD-dependent tricarballylate dehydrogenase TcuA [Hyphomicrobiales bacterium]